MRRFLLCCWFVCQISVSADGEKNANLEPNIETHVKGVSLTLVAEHPDVMTPTGIDVDATGALWFVCSHTHFRPENYDGPEHDEVVVLRDGRRTVFYDKTDATMDLELSPDFANDGWVYLAERDRVLRVRDSDGDGVGDTEEDVAVLETEGVYPHNGLSGMAWQTNGDLVFSLGENFWKEWRLSSRDGSSVRGTGEGGIFRCGADGSGLKRIAKGFWNPFGVCVRADGSMFACENDPGSRPPCRLLHIVPGGDYGYQRLYGNNPHHPFVCWDGELPGTLPMLFSVGEAPCGIAPLNDGLLVTSWTDHRIDFYPLQADGASFKTDRISLVSGSLDFRPTCIVQQSPTVYYFTDWVVGSYQLHQKGRIWRLEIDPTADARLRANDIPAPTPSASLASVLRDGGRDISNEQLFHHAESDDAFVARAALDSLSLRVDEFDWKTAHSWSGERQISLLLAIRTASPKDATWAARFLKSDNSDVKFQALRWIADERLEQFAPDVKLLLNSNHLDYQLFEASLAAHNTLSGNPRDGIKNDEVLLKQIADKNASPITRAYALRMIDPKNKKLKAVLQKLYWNTGHRTFDREFIRTLAATKTSWEEVAFRMPPGDPMTQAWGVSVIQIPDEDLFESLFVSEDVDRDVYEEVLRRFRGLKLTKVQRKKIEESKSRHPDSADMIDAILNPKSVAKGRPPATDIDAWQKRLAAIPGPANIEAGERIFHHQRIGACSKCHRHNGRGQTVGPDLSTISNQGDPTRLLKALLQPSRDVDPQYFPRTLIFEDGTSFTGFMLRDGGGGKEFYRDSEGRERSFRTEEIVARRELRTSLMPDGLIDTMTDREIRDLLAFLDAEQSREALANANVEASDFLGQWWLEFNDGYGGWISIEKNERYANEFGLPIDGESEYHCQFLWRIGAPRKIADPKFDRGVVSFSTKRRGTKSIFRARISGNDIVVSETVDGSQDAFRVARGKRCPPMPPRPNLEKVKFAEPIRLFNGNDLTGWRLQPATAKNGWSVRNGELVNQTPKTDFSGYGDYGNLRTTKEFGDCRLHIEFNVDAKCNSGIYVRGLYEVQVVDRDSSMQGKSGPGAIFGRVVPTKNAGLPGGDWQTYAITLVDQHITVKLNGETVIDNQPVSGCTGGALLGDVSSLGPLYLQGDHTNVRFRNILLEPRIPN